MVKEIITYVCENCKVEYLKEEEARECCNPEPKYFLNEKEKEIVIRWWRQEYGIPDYGGFFSFFKKKLPREIMEKWYDIFPNDWERINKKKTILKYPTWKSRNKKERKR